MDFSLSLDEKVWKITEMYYDNQVFAKSEDAASEVRPKMASSKYGLKMRCPAIRTGENDKLFFPGPLELMGQKKTEKNLQKKISCKAVDG